MKVRQVQRDKFSELLVNKPCFVLIAKYNFPRFVDYALSSVFGPLVSQTKLLYKISGSRRCLLFYLFYLNASTRTCEGEIELITAEKYSRVILTSTLSEISRF